MRYYLKCPRARNSGSTGSYIFPLQRMVGHWRSYRVWTLTWMILPIQWLRDPPKYFSIEFNYSPIRGVDMNSSFSYDVSTGKGDFWKLTSYFVFVNQYYWMMFLMIWSEGSIMMTWSIWMMLMLRGFIFSPSWKVYSNRVSYYLISISNKIL